MRFVLDLWVYQNCKNKDLTKSIEKLTNKITEDVTLAWYERKYQIFTHWSVTNLTISLVKRITSYLDTTKKYSWIKSPLYSDRMEVRPLLG